MSRARDRRRRADRRTRRRWLHTLGILSPPNELDQIIRTVSRRPERKRTRPSAVLPPPALVRRLTRQEDSR